MTKLFNDEQEEFVRAFIPGHSYQQIIDEIFREFELELKKSQIRSWIRNHKLSTGRNGQFGKGHIPMNKGKHQKITGRMRETMFKEGRTPFNYDQLGTEKVKGDGYIWIKIAEPNIWKQKHRCIYEAVHGSIAQGKRIMFADGNNRNFDIDNLVEVSPGEMLQMTRNNRISSDQEVTKTYLNVTKLDIAVAKSIKKARKLDDKSDI
jgi:hypothetical protein